MGEQLAGAGTVCTRLLVVAETDHGERCERVWYRSAGLSVAAMVERIRWQLDAWVAHDQISAGVTLVQLEALEVHADDGVQLGLWGGRTQADEWAARAVARLAALAGEQQVLVPVADGGRQPDQAFRWTPAVTVDLLAEPVAAGWPGSGQQGSGQQGSGRPVEAPPWPGQLPSPSPATVLPQPLPIQVIDADQQPVRVGGRGGISAPPALVTAGTTEAVVAWAGPWPIEERWWDAARARRVARFQVQLASGRLLLIGLERQQWSLLAEYD